MKRILMALWFVPLFLLSIYNDAFVFLLHFFIVLVTVNGTNELFKMAGYKKEYLTKYVTIIFLVAAYIRYFILSGGADLGYFNQFLSSRFLEGPVTYPTMFVLGGLLGALFIINLFRKEYTQEIGGAIILSIFAAVYTGFFTWHIVMLRLLLDRLGSLGLPEGQGKYYISMLLAAVWFMDAGAYYFGRLLGKHKLKDTASPNKSIEGVLGGFISSVVLTFLFNLLVSKTDVLSFVWGEVYFFTLPEILLIALFFAFVGFVGDMGESIIKRAFHTKDSSDMIAGHGGVLDVFDSMIFAAPIMYYLIYFLSVWGILHSTYSIIR